MPTPPLDADDAARAQTACANRLLAHVEATEDGPDVCTLFPADPDDPLTEWLSAEEGSYVALSAMR
ncbi:hypothetical protein EFA46_011565 (plasmid) [Halarchaeum sp. CBA1220]|uniref:DUF7511 domain-containing protein n=1 Tax=Halarchaeum sp. CBA1220 TaxID=1853682 RepID=UPI0011CE0F36|nr:hypothetical protein [Halarchaeum sp. CBA1220]QLC34891.1 hypothetical protein EFA46_011565 [Halarchaeum sp. CBA1220]